MHNIAEGFDSETNPEFIRFLRYSKRSCTEVHSELYIAVDEEYISTGEFKDVYEQARRTHAAVRGFPACHARPEIYAKNGLLAMFRV